MSTPLEMTGTGRGSWCGIKKAALSYLCATTFIPDSPFLISNDPPSVTSVTSATSHHLWLTLSHQNNLKTHHHLSAVGSSLLGREPRTESIARFVVRVFKIPSAVKPLMGTDGFRPTGPDQPATSYWLPICGEAAGPELLIPNSFLSLRMNTSISASISIFHTKKQP